MVLDIRALGSCSLGELISASISDDYVQGNGLIKTQGSCVIKGITVPAPGTNVTFSYTKNGTTTNIPRLLRVISSFANASAGTTEVQLGCSLTYQSGVKAPIRWNPYSDPLNAAVDPSENKIVLIPMNASSIAEKCLQSIGLALASGSNFNVLTNTFSIEYFDYSSGYVNILNDLLVSECFCGYMNENNEFSIFSLNQTGGTGPLIDAEKIIDIRGINVGEIPGDAVTVSYSTLKLEASGPEPKVPDPDNPDNPYDPDDPDDPNNPNNPDSPNNPNNPDNPNNQIDNPPRNQLPPRVQDPSQDPDPDPQVYADKVDQYKQWLARYKQVREDTGSPVFSTITFGGDESSEKTTVTNIPITISETRYSAIVTKNLTDNSISTDQEQIDSEETESKNIAGITAAGIYQKISDAYYEAGFNNPKPLFNLTADTNTSIIKTYVAQTESYEEVEEIKYISACEIAGQMNLESAFVVEVAGQPGVEFVNFSTDYVAAEKTVYRKTKLDLVEISDTYYYRLWHQTLSGQIATATASKNNKIKSAAEASAYFDSIIAGGLCFDYKTSSINFWVNKPTMPVSREYPVSAYADPKSRVTRPVPASGGLTPGGLLPSSGGSGPFGDGSSSGPSAGDTGLPSDGGSDDTGIGSGGSTSPDPAVGTDQTSGNADTYGTQIDYRTNSQSVLQFILGDQEGKRVLQLSMPYAPDDKFFNFYNLYYAVASDAPQKANNFGRTQYNLIYGHRYGMNITTAPELIPDTPFSPIVIELDGYAGMFMTNGTTWVMDSEGVIVSTDGLFLGGVGGPV